MIDFNLILTFLEVARLENLHVAAQKLHVTPSALSQRIKLLEDQIGKSLFLRKRSGMEINRHGKKLRELCVNLELERERIENWMMSEKDYIGGRLRIATIPGISSYVFPNFMETFLNQYPDITTTISANISAGVEEWVLSGKADLGIIAGNCQKPSLKTQRLFVNNPIIMVCSPDYFLAKRKRITKKDLSEAEMIWHVDKPSRTLREISRKLGISPHTGKGSLNLPSMDAAKQHALKGLGVACVAKLYVNEELKNRTLIALPNFMIKIALHLISRNEKYESPAVKIFKKKFVEYCHKLDKEWKD